MNVQELLGDFLSSGHGQQALAAFTANGVAPDDAQAALGHATNAVADHLKDGGAATTAHQGLGNFFTAFAAGIAKGDGLTGALEDGAAGALVGAVTGALVEKAGMDPKMASTIAAAATPFIVGYLKEKL
jgi:hypothetical protein